MRVDNIRVHYTLSLLYSHSHVTCHYLSHPSSESTSYKIFKTTFLYINAIYSYIYMYIYIYIYICINSRRGSLICNVCHCCLTNCIMDKSLMNSPTSQKLSPPMINAMTALNYLILINLLILLLANRNPYHSSPCWCICS